MVRSYTAPTSFSSASAVRARPSGDSSTSRTVRRTLASTAALSNTAGASVGSTSSRPGRCARAAASSGWRGRRHGTSRRSPPPPRRNPRAQHNEQRRAQVRAGVFRRPWDLGTEHVPGDAHDEQFAESGVEQQLGRHAAVAAAQNGGEGMLALVSGRRTCMRRWRLVVRIVPLIPLDERPQRNISSE